MMTPYFQTSQTALYHGDALLLPPELRGQFNAVITDPPYSSGGAFRADRANANTNGKYLLDNKQKTYPQFYGDNKDQRAFAMWLAMVLCHCHRLLVDGGVLMMFTDWRQLPTVSDVLQCGGFVWRGIIPWNKTEAVRPQKGWFRAQCEYVLTASKGSLGCEQEREGECLAGFYSGCMSGASKLHATEKPVGLLQSLMRVLPPGSTILDPFAGSGSTGEAARNLGHHCTLMEQSAEYCEIIKTRLAGNLL